MRYQVQINQAGCVRVVKLKSSKSNAPTHIKTRRLAKKFAKLHEQEIQQLFVEGFMSFLEQLPEGVDEE